MTNQIIFFKFLSIIQNKHPAFFLDYLEWYKIEIFRAAEAYMRNVGLPLCEARLECGRPSEVSCIKTLVMVCRI